MQSNIEIRPKNFTELQETVEYKNWINKIKQNHPYLIELYGNLSE